MTARTAALYMLRLVGFLSIREGLQAEMHDNKVPLAMGMGQPQEIARKFLISPGAPPLLATAIPSPICRGHLVDAQLL